MEEPQLFAVDPLDQSPSALAPGEIVVSVLPEPTGIGSEFDYRSGTIDPAALHIGTLVSVVLAGRTVEGWVTGRRESSDHTGRLEPIRKVLSLGPPADVGELCDWAAERWAGKRSVLWKIASPDRRIKALPPARRTESLRPAAKGAAPDSEAEAAVTEAIQHPVATIVTGATTPLTPILAAAARRGRLLVLCPTHAQARRAAAALRGLGVAAAHFGDDWAVAATGATTVGARSAAFAPTPGLDLLVVIDEHDAAYCSESSPTWNGRDVAIERGRRLGIPVLLVSPCPSPDALAAGPAVPLGRAVVRRGWPALQIIDTTDADPRDRRYPEELIAQIRRSTRTVVVLNRTGRSRLLACRACSSVLTCSTCDAAVGQSDGTDLSCARCGTVRPLVCQNCGSTAVKNLRAGVDRVAEELGAILGEPVPELRSASDAQWANARCVLGTEAVLHRERRAELVVFLDFDQELLAPRYRATEEAAALLARGARLLGPTARSGLVVLSTQSAHPVLDAVTHSDLVSLAESELARRRLLRFPPAESIAIVGGAAAPAFAASLATMEGFELAQRDDRWIVRTSDGTELGPRLGRVTRPPGRLTLHVDPHRIR